MFVSQDQVFLCIVSIISLPPGAHTLHTPGQRTHAVCHCHFILQFKILTKVTLGSLSYTHKKGEYLLQGHYVVLPSFDFVCDSLKPLCNLLGHVMHAPTKLKGRCQGVDWLYCSNKVRLTSSSMKELSACTL